MARNAWVFVKGFGRADQQNDLAAKINEQTHYFATVQNGVVFVEVKLHELAEFFDVMQSNDAFNWIEFSVRVDVD